MKKQRFSVTDLLGSNGTGIETQAGHFFTFIFLIALLAYTYSQLNYKHEAIYFILCYNHFSLINNSLMFAKAGAI